MKLDQIQILGPQHVEAILAMAAWRSYLADVQRTGGYLMAGPRGWWTQEGLISSDDGSKASRSWKVACPAAVDLKYLKICGSRAYKFQAKPPRIEPPRLAWE